MSPVLNQNALLEEAQQIHNDLIAWRRELHKNPELGFQEEKTARFVEERLTNMGIEIQGRFGKTGIAALVRGKKPGSTVGLRADMDALPIQDQKSVPYASKVEGKAHLCGHDAHTTMLLGAAHILVKNPPEAGNVKLIFQPAEEGLGGADAMIKDGVLTNPTVGAIAALHVFPGIPTGQLTTVSGVSCAAADFIQIEIIGKGGHAAHPHLSVDSIAVTGEVISALQHIASRQIDPLSPIVITLGKIEGGYASNVIAPSVRLEGTVRTLDPAVRETIEKRIETVIKGICDAYGATFKFHYRYGYPSVVNAESLQPILAETAKDVLGEGSLSIAKPSMGGEDFAYFAQQIPGIMFRLGVGSEEKGSIYPLHHPFFDIDEDALPLGSAMLAQFVHNYLGKSESK
jgi:amidohydrolase